MAVWTEIKKALKAVIAGAIAFLSTLAGAISVDTTLESIVLLTWVLAAVAGLTAFSAVYFASNKT